MLPSKGLLSSVYGKVVTRADDRINEETNEWYFEVELIDDYEQYYVNIYELMHMMKEWALKKGYFLKSGLSGKTKIYKHSAYCEIEGFEYSIIVLDTEFEAVTKACEWIMEQQNVSK